MQDLVRFLHVFDVRNDSDNGNDGGNSDVELSE